MDSELSDIAAERGLLSGIVQFGQECFLDVADIVNEQTFTVEYNRLIYNCLNHLFKNDVQQIDTASIHSAGQELGLTNFFNNIEFSRHLQSLFTFPIAIKNVRRMASKIRKLEIARLMRINLKQIGRDLLDITGEESITEILSIVENSVFDFSTKLQDNDEGPKCISDNIVEYVQHLAENPIDQIGISTGFPKYDMAIGGGLRPGTINVIGARIKTGKSMIGSNMGYYIANQHKIPVLNMDTEMTYDDHLNRMIAMASESYIYDIETGKFAQKPGQHKQVKSAAEYIERNKIPYYHKSIAGMPFEEQLAILRRWIVKKVGLKPDGKANPCVIVYDYLKLMTSEGINGALQEYQLLGFMMTSLHNFSVRYGVPFLLFIQLNRDGVEKESSTAASGSDRIMWLCSNFTIFKHKSDEEIGLDGPENGNRKLVPIVARHGGGMQSGDYINCYFKGSVAKIVEGKTKFEIGENNEKKQIEKGGDYSSGELTGFSEGEDIGF
jgi:replicative DNA helicase